MLRAWTLYALHVAALAFGLGGILIALPNPHLWSGSELGAEVFEFGMNYGGASHIIFGALAMLALGSVALGWKRTMIFFAVAYPISLSAELIGTSTGWPFGNYAYTSGLGLKVLDKVPFTIPLSWFYVGFASYLLGITLARRFTPQISGIVGVLTGVYLLVVWDLVLDPAMAHEDLPIKFWEWSDTGPYFGMPLINFVGWALTALIFIAAARVIWRHDPSEHETPVVLPFMVYLANMIFAMALSLSVDLWEPVVIAGILGMIPAVVALQIRPRSSTAEGTGSDVGKAFLSRGAALLIRRRGGVTVDRGLPPETGPAILVSRHYHHLWDGCAIVASTDRPVHIVVGLDWISKRPIRTLMETACKSAGWPVILRDDALHRDGAESVYEPHESRAYLKRAVRESVEILRGDGLLVMFPEAYPNIDPGYTPKTGDDDSLPFKRGFATIARITERRLGKRVPIIPVGLGYKDPESGPVAVRFGEPVYLDEFPSEDELVRSVEHSVYALSGVEGIRAEVPRETVAVS